MAEMEDGDISRVILTSIVAQSKPRKEHHREEDLFSSALNPE